MSLVDIRVELPTHSHSFIVTVPPKCSVLEIKQEIHKTCPGQPRPDGQKLIWRGRLLSDNETVDSLWQTDPRVVHLSVHPLAWSSPPESPGYKHVLRHPNKLPDTPSSPSSSHTTTGPSSQIRRPAFTYVIYQHQRALSALSSSVPIPKELESPELHRLVAKDHLKQNGWSWPDILDAEFPPPSDGGLIYESANIDGQLYLRLINPDAIPTAIQAHSLRLLTSTFSIISMSMPTHSPVRITPAQSISVPPHFNQILQQMGLPPLRAPNDNHNVVQAIANQDNLAVPEIREIPIRPLLAPLMMLVLRSMLLLYFFEPARKPFIGALIFAWMLYEVWRPIRNALRDGLDAQGQQRQGNNGVQNNDDVAQPNVNGGWRPGVNLRARPNIMAGTLDQQVDAFLDGLAHMNIVEEERLLETTPGNLTPEPGTARKIMTFVVLLFSTLHPAIWNRRLLALRRREGTIRTEANARNITHPNQMDNEEENRRTQVREDLRARFENRPGWMQEYIQRVVDEGWVDDSD